MYSIEELEKDLKNTLSEKRYNHSLMVMEEAKNYIAKYQPNDESFYQRTVRAALMHDMAKEMTMDKIKLYIADNNIDLDVDNPINKPLIHGIIGADLCLKKYDFDEEMAQAIRWHTTGSINMSLMDKIVFLADKTGRNNLDEEMKEIRKLAFDNLDKAIYLYISNNIERLKNRNIPINQISIDVKENIGKRLD